MKYTVCTGCPILNNDYEYGSECNLGFDTNYRIVSQKGRRLAQISQDCGLKMIDYEGGEFIPKTLEIEVINETHI